MQKGGNLDPTWGHHRLMQNKKKVLLDYEKIGFHNKYTHGFNGQFFSSCSQHFFAWLFVNGLFERQNDRFFHFEICYGKSNYKLNAHCAIHSK